MANKQQKKNIHIHKHSGNSIIIEEIKTEKRRKKKLSIKWE